MFTVSQVKPVSEAWPRLDEWLDVAGRERILGPGCGSAEFEGWDWRSEVTWRMTQGYRPGLVARYREWLSKEDACPTPNK